MEDLSWTNKGAFQSVCSQLNLRKNILLGDIRDIAYHWDNIMEEAEKPRCKAIFNTLHGLTRSYLRGRNIRMGSWLNSRRYSDLDSMLTLLVFEFVIARGDTWYQKLHKLGINSMKNTVELMMHYFDPDIIEQAEQIIRQED